MNDVEPEANSADQSEDSSPIMPELYQHAAAAGAGAMFGAAIPGPAGQIVGAALGAFLVPFAKKVWEELSGDAQERIVTALSAAEEVIGSPEELERLATSSEKARLQTGLAMSAASRTAWPPKVRALGRALAAGLMATDDTQIEVEPMIMAALADIEFPHASLLELLLRYWPSVEEGRILARPYADTTDTWQVGQRVWDPGDIFLVRPNLRPVLPSLMGTLQRHGLAVLSDNSGDPFGRTGDAMQRRFMGDLASKQGSWADLENVVRYAPAGSYLPTQLGQKVLDALVEAGAEFTDK
jgi:hypothetical protein